MKIGIYDTDTFFLNRICMILEEKKKTEDMKFVSLSRKDIDLKDSGIDMYVVSEDLEKIVKSYSVPYMLLSENEENNRDFLIYKYSNVWEYLKKISEYFELYEKNRKQKNKKIISFLSLGGGMGSSTIATSSALRLAKQGKEVLYVNLKPFSGNGYFKNELANIYIDELVKKNVNTDNEKISLKEKLNKNKMGITILNNCKEAGEFYSISNEQLCDLINILREFKGYEYIIIDIQISNDSYIYEILNISDTICCVLDGGYLGNEKIKRAITYLKQIDETIMNKFKIIYNKNSRIMEMDKDLDVKVIGNIEYIKEPSFEKVIEKITYMSLLDELSNK
ncbi:MAG: AAA family ATPase [Lachnospiraceae bacterium]|nr:AAA family ATPase [Lachnospiraceae bacterium]